jgi:hypothetical protein
VIDDHRTVIRIGSILLRVDDLDREAAFWAAALRYERRVNDSDDFVLLYLQATASRYSRTPSSNE